MLPILGWTKYSVLPVAEPCISIIRLDLTTKWKASLGFMSREHPLLLRATLEFMKITDSLLCIIHRLIFQKSLPDHMHGRNPVFVLCPSDLIAIHHICHTAPSLRFRIREASVLRRSPESPCRSTARCPPLPPQRRLHSGVHVCHSRIASR